MVISGRGTRYDDLVRFAGQDLSLITKRKILRERFSASTTEPPSCLQWLRNEINTRDEIRRPPKNLISRPLNSDIDPAFQCGGIPAAPIDLTFVYHPFITTSSNNAASLYHTSPPHHPFNHNASLILQTSAPFSSLSRLPASPQSLPYPRPYLPDVLIRPIAFRNPSRLSRPCQDFPPRCRWALCQTSF